MNWISTKIGLPNKGIKCLVVDSENEVWFSEWIDLFEEPIPGMGKTCTGQGWEDFMFDDIKYWMPIPELPKQD